MRTAHRDLRRRLRKLSEGWQDYPNVVQLEMSCVCNAKCAFCPYATSSRKGTRMSEEVFEKALRDLRVPGRSPEVFHLEKLGEPFLDSRLFRFASRLGKVFPRATLAIITNGSLLPPETVAKLCELPNLGSLAVSFHSFGPARETLMQLPVAPAYEALQRMHVEKVAGRLPFNVRVHRVGQGDPADRKFYRRARREFPLFSASVTKQCTWQGRCPGGEHTPDVGCKQWFNTAVMANGKVPFCCMDEGENAVGDIKTDNLLDIHNRPSARRLRTRVPSRRTLPQCHGCWAGLHRQF